MTALSDGFRDFPDDEHSLRAEGLAYFRYAPTGKGGVPFDLDALIASGHVKAEPITYEDFLPVSAAGIFASNLGDESQHDHADRAARDAFGRDLGVPVADETALYAALEQASIEATRTALSFPALA